MTLFFNKRLSLTHILKDTVVYKKIIILKVDNAMRKYDKFRDDLFAEILQHLSNGKAGAET